MPYEKIQQTKLITTYGAVGSLIETLSNGTLRILEFDQWPYYRYLLNRYGQHEMLEIPENLLIRDERLLYRIRSEKNLTNLEGLFRLPENSTGFDLELLEEHKVIAGKMFPGWYLCPACRTDNLRHERVLINPHLPRFPRCPIHGHIHLDQFPFILVSESGKMCDIPWMNFIDAPPNANMILFEMNDPDAYGGTLTYSSGGSAELLATKTIRNGAGIPRSLARLGSIQFVSGGETFKVVSRHGNNVCFIEKLSSVSVPGDIFLPSNVRGILDALFDMARTFVPDATADLVYDRYTLQNPGSTVTLEQVRHHFAIRNEDRWDEDTKYKSEEYAFFLNNNEWDSADLRFRKFASDSPLFADFAMIDRIKVVHAQSSYSRLMPEAAKNPIFSNPNVRLYPAIEMFGEGVLIFFDLETLNQFAVHHGLDEAGMLPVIHTCVHSVIRELEFHTGYSVNSMNERLYFKVSEKDGIIEAGALIYSASTAEGSYGGLATLFVQDEDGRIRFFEVVEEALRKARECSNDPVCESETISNGSRGVCYACNLLPEITCEQFNMQLDRGRMIEYLDYANDPVG